MFRGFASVVACQRLGLVSRAHFRLLALVISSGLLTGCGTPSLQLPERVWNALYLEEANRNTVLQDVKVLKAEHCEKIDPKTKEKVTPEKGCDAARRAYDKASGDWNALFSTVQAIIVSNRQLGDWTKTKNDKGKDIPGFSEALYNAQQDTDAFMSAYKTVICPETCKEDVVPILTWLFPIGQLITAQNQANADERKNLASQLSKIMWPLWECVGVDSPACSPPKANPTGSTSRSAPQTPALKGEGLALR